METKSRKDAIKEFKERKVQAGAYAVRCEGTVWAGTSRNLGATKNGVWFALRSGGHREASLQKEWNRLGENAFTFEVLEVLDEDLHPLRVADLLKERRAYWVGELGATLLY